MDKHYDPHVIEEKWMAHWLEKGYFGRNPENPAEPYCVMIPPPNVTGILHMGHALNNTIQDILVRWRRMQGRNALWVYGTDHAGIATQNVVERALAKEGSNREALGREAFLERVWDWREQYGGTIKRQLKRLGASCDWDNERFTMDEGLSDAVAEVFVRLYDKGLIYRANYIINWCPRCHTALSDEESEHQDTAGKLYHIRYPLREGTTPDGKAYITVATTRPETLLGDVAVAVHPDDPRYKGLEACVVELPILNRALKVIRDAYVDPAFGTGVVKITPAHDPNDFEMGQRHGLPQINVMHGDGRMNDVAGPYAGMDRFACRKQIIADLDAAGLIGKVDEHQHAVGHCYRCDAVVEPRLSPQWFVRMKPLAEPALAAVNDGRVTFVPDRWTKVYREWMENIRDWCISRQIWWGHRIPVFTCVDCNYEWAAKGQPLQCPKCNSASIEQETDVLDTWFSSWLWPFSTLGWPEKTDALRTYYPTHDLATASEIIFFWVARMVMAGLEFVGEVPFRTVYIHGTVRDDKGRKMSKSLGNSIDPLSIIEETSADALRFSLIMLTATGQDVHVSREKFELGRNFGTKMWNAARFMQMNSEGAPCGQWARELVLQAGASSADDAHMLLRFQDAVRNVTENLEKYRFNDAAAALYEFVWHQFCDWYLEYAKTVFQGEKAQREQTLQIMHYCFAGALRLLHPFMPFVTEELWHAMGYARDAEDTILRAPWPVLLSKDFLAEGGIAESDGVYVDARHELIRLGRQLRADYGLAPSDRLPYVIKPDDAVTAERLKTDLAALTAGLRASDVVVTEAPSADQSRAGLLSPLGMIYLPLEGIVDLEAERRRVTEEIGKVEKFLLGANQKLQNSKFVDKAPADVVANVRATRAELATKLEKLQEQLQVLINT
ncbi:MAG: valine--tRNA ligase [Kiritimatiellia bacterium]